MKLLNEFYSIKERIEDYVTDEHNSLKSRYKLHIKTNLGIHVSYSAYPPEELVNMSVTGDIAWYDDLYMERGEKISINDFIFKLKDKKEEKDPNWNITDKKLKELKNFFCVYFISYISNNW